MGVLCFCRIVIGLFVFGFKADIFVLIQRTEMHDEWAAQA
jgi:hypothetical protein